MCFLRTLYIYVYIIYKCIDNNRSTRNIFLQYKKNVDIIALIFYILLKLNEC